MMIAKSKGGHFSESEAGIFTACHVQERRLKISGIYSYFLAVHGIINLTRLIRYIVYLSSILTNSLPCLH